MASCRSYQFLFSLMSFAIILCGAHANAESVDVSSFPYERSYSLAPDAEDTYRVTLAKGEAVLMRANLNSGLSQDCDNNFVRIQPIDDKGEVLVDRVTTINEVNRAGQGNPMATALYAERAGSHSFRFVREMVSSSQCTSTDFPVTISLTKHTGNVDTTERANAVTGMVRKTLGFMQSHEYVFRGVVGKPFSAQLRTDSGRDGFCNAYVRLKLLRRGGFNSIAETVDYSIAPIGNSSSPLKISTKIKNNGTYTLRIERQFSKFDEIECDDSAYNYQLRMRVPKRARK